VTRVKICGITRLEDAELAVEHGAWAIGFILWPGSKRFADPAVAAGIARRLRRQVQIVGVFVNQPIDEIAHTADQVGLTHVQLHGDEGPAFATEVGRRTGAKVIKAARVQSRADLQALERYRVDFHLLDAHTEGLRGGSGRSWDWELSPHRRSKVPAILSGGLTADNVAGGIAAVRPYAVDVASGTEASPGIKDPEKVRAFLAAAHAADGAPVGGSARPAGARS
jgi:phosphoribosylanthranilate isomerase